MNVNTLNITIDGRESEVSAGLSVRKAALQNGVYIPGLCSHPELDSFKPFNWSEEIWQGQSKFLHMDTALESRSEDAGQDFPHCDLCLVSVDGGEPQRSCSIRVEEGMVIETTSSEIIHARQNALKKILARHPHACLTCAQREGCDRVQCSMNVPVEERCCELLGRCEIGKVAEFVGIPTDTPPYRNENRPAKDDEPLFDRDYELCISCLRCVRVCRDVRGVDVLGAVNTDGGVKVGTQGGSTLTEALCRYCGACVGVCPTGALQDKSQCEPLVDGRAPCVAACPLEIDVPGYMDLITHGLDYEALELIRQRAVLPGVLGYACFHPCEDVCRRGSLDDPASICSLKRYVSDVAGDRPAQVDKKPPTGKKVAIIGGGPAGLASAAELLKLGHEVTIFEQSGSMGGMLVQSIPDFRLPPAVVERDLQLLYDLGVKQRTNIEFGNDVTIEQLTAEGFDSTVIAIGLSEPARLGVQDENLQNVEHGLDFLRNVKAGKIRHLTGSTVVIGGGSVAVDAAMTVRRLGDGRVRMVCLENENEIPASRDELNAALTEDIEIDYRWGVDRIEGEGSAVARIILKKCTQVFDSQGNFAPVYDEEEIREIACDNVLIAIGQRIAPEMTELLVEKDGVFIAGDVRTGPGSIVAAMADGRSKAFRVHQYLTGESVDETPVQIEQFDKFLGREEDFHTNSRSIPDTVPAGERISSLNAFKSTLSESMARKEAARCLRCHLRASLIEAPLPPDPWHEFTVDIVSQVPDVEGVLILADESKLTVKIEGAADIRAACRDLLADGITAKYCRWELDPMYTKRESELILTHLQAHGEMPDSDDLDDLF